MAKSTVDDLSEQKRQLIRGVRRAAADWIRELPDPSASHVANVVVGGLADVTAIAATSGFEVSREQFAALCVRSYDEALELRRRREAG
jgi:hypothetical protein